MVEEEVMGAVECCCVDAQAGTWRERKLEFSLLAEVQGGVCFVVGVGSVTGGQGRRATRELGPQI